PGSKRRCGSLSIGRSIFCFPRTWSSSSRLKHQSWIERTTQARVIPQPEAVREWNEALACLVIDARITAKTLARILDRSWLARHVHGFRLLVCSAPRTSSTLPKYVQGVAKV